MSREDIDRTDEERRRKNRWITDAIFIVEVLMFIVTSTARSLIIYDASNLHHIPLWLILGIPNILHVRLPLNIYKKSNADVYIFLVFNVLF